MFKATLGPIGSYYTPSNFYTARPKGPVISNTGILGGGSPIGLQAIADVCVPQKTSLYCPRLWREVEEQPYIENVTNPYQQQPFPGICTNGAFLTQLRLAPRIQIKLLKAGAHKGTP